MQSSVVRNNKKHSEVLFKMGGSYPIVHTIVSKKKQVFEIMLATNQNISIGILKDIVSVNIHDAAREHFGNAVGMLGSFDGKLLARDGVTTYSMKEEDNDIGAYGQEWQVRDDEPMLFRAVRAPQYPQACRLPTKQSSLKAKESRRLGQGGISEEDAKVACVHVKHDQQVFAACVYDVTVMNDLDQAEAY
ncbi:expressed unknown protein [Seminavis robusta]|uniref:Uncharacterized protein n=1 Tax=Seminavis robusta TaxID=568900 RepID=A0A9N8E2W5_9STRA|nr:expressed unknown protein [Seminavis robusta]|eukprot:Sro501_g155470.1 n/a (190) ;mRNA; r:30526-31095